MERTNLDMSWLVCQRPEFWLEPEKQRADLPHDWAIGQVRRPDAPSGAAGGFFPGAELIYERELYIPRDAGQTVLLEFEGVYCNAEVYINGLFVHTQHYGYSGFIIDASKAVRRESANLMRVFVNGGAMPNSRWYAGVGIYRHVWMHTSGESYIYPWGLTVETLSLSGADAELRVRARIAGDRRDTRLRVSIPDAEGLRNTLTEVPVSAGEETRVPLILKNAKLWSDRTPYLYTLECELLKGNSICDAARTPFGVRTISVDSENGLRINGKTLKLKGGCIHHDNGLIGAVSFDRAEERKAELLKASGFNAVRCAHNPPAPAFLSACDRLGLYVLEEAFDCWREGKNPYDYHMFFERDWEKDLEAMVLRDGKHPSVILWSTGNEIPERDGRNDGYRLARALYDLVKRMDGTRPVINCLCRLDTGAPCQGTDPDGHTDGKGGGEDADPWGVRTGQFTDFLDVVGYNYLLARYPSDGEKFPKRVIAGSESYPSEALENWRAVGTMPHVIGDFVWTAMDYLGEAGLGHVWRGGESGFLGGYPWRTAWCGDIDICGHKRPQSFFRDAVWGIDRTPFIAVMHPGKYKKPCEISEWGWPDVEPVWDYPGMEGKPAGVEVYSSCDEVALFLNGRLVERKSSGEKAGFRTLFEVGYEPGELSAVAYREGRECGGRALKTAGPAAKLRLYADRTDLQPQYGDLAYIDIVVQDGAGNVAAAFDRAISVFVSGPGKLLAAGTADPKSEESFSGGVCRPYRGCVTAVVCVLGAGEIEVGAACQGLDAETLKLTAG